MFNNTYSRVCHVLNEILFLFQLVAEFPPRFTEASLSPSLHTKINQKLGYVFEEQTSSQSYGNCCPGPKILQHLLSLLLSFFLSQWKVGCREVSKGKGKTNIFYWLRLESAFRNSLKLVSPLHISYSRWDFPPCCTWFYTNVTAKSVNFSFVWKNIFNYNCQNSLWRSYLFR